MAAGSWDEILKGYRSFNCENLQYHLLWMEKFVSHLLANRDLSGIYPVTTLTNLNLTFADSFLGMKRKPHLIISTNSSWEGDIEKREYHFKLIHYKNETDLRREKTESIFCSFEKSLEAFDELIEKLKVFGFK